MTVKIEYLKLSSTEIFMFVLIPIHLPIPTLFLYFEPNIAANKFIIIFPLWGVLKNHI